MPAAMSHFGVTLGVLLIIWCGLTSAFGLYLQARCARYLDRGTSSFFALSQITYPNAAVVFDAAIAIKCFGVGVSYMIIIGDLMPGVAEAFGALDSGLDFLSDRKFWITAFFLVFIIPLSFPKRLDSLKYTSMVALVAIGYLIILVVYHFAADEIPNDRDIRLIRWEGPVAALSSLPVVIFAYTCHQNVGIICQLYTTLLLIRYRCSPSSTRSRTTPRAVLWLSLPLALARRRSFTSWLLSPVISPLGTPLRGTLLACVCNPRALTGPEPDADTSLDPPSVASTIAKAAIVALVTFSIPLQIHPCRASIDAVLRWRPNGGQRPAGPGNQPLLPSAAAAVVADSHGAPPVVAMSELRFALITSAILILSYITALEVSSLDRVLAYVGSTGSTAISFILPGLFYYKISDPDSIYHQRLSKEDDDVDLAVDADDDDADADDAGDLANSGLLSASVASLRSTASGASARRSSWSRWRRKWRWDLEHLETGLLRKLALSLSIYGVCVMIVCLIMNSAFSH
jgi:amino acid permease